MSHLLAHLPVEILANITCRLTDLEVLLRLSACGSLLLAAKLRAGGVTTLDLTMKRLSKSHIELIQSFKLLFFTARAPFLPLRQLKTLIWGLSSDLLHLIVFHPQAICLAELNEEIDASGPYIPVRASICAPWIVASAFHRLQTLRLHGRFELGKLMNDAENTFRFFQGLPSTLIHLHLDGKPNIDVFRLVPPNLTTLSGLKACQPKDIHSLHSLTSLELDIADDPASAYTDLLCVHPDFKRDDSSITNWDIATASSTLIWPLHLAHLDIFTPTIPLQPFPETLTSLSWRCDPGWQHYSELLRSIPSSASRLELCFRRESMTQDAGTMPPPLSKVKYFKFILAGGSYDLSWEHRMYSDFLRFLPNVEHLLILDTEAQSGMDDSHLELLNGASLITLRAAFRDSCFAMHEGQSLIARALPRLKKLIMNRTMEDLILFSFAALPPTVTHLIVGTPTPIATLHLLPPSVTQFEASALNGNHSAENFNDLLLTPSPSPTSAIASTALTPSQESLNISTIASQVHSFSQTARRKLTRRYSESGQVSIHLSESSDGNVAVEYYGIQFALFPTSLTSLTLDVISAHPTQLRDLTARTLPNLTYLDLGSFLAPSNVGEFQALRTLRIPQFKKNLPVACPPHLTELVVARPSRFPDNFPLPPSTMTRIHAVSCNIALSILEPLTQLVSFAGCYRPENNLPLAERLDPFLNSLPTTLTELVIADLVTFHQYPLSSIAARFPALRRLGLHRITVSEAKLAELHDCFPLATFTVNLSRTLNDPALIASRAGFRHGEVQLSADLMLDAWLARACTKAFPRWTAMEEQETIRANLSPRMIAEFGPYLSRDTTELINLRFSPTIEREYWRPEDLSLETCRLPSWITVIDITAIIQDLPRSPLTLLPDTLLDLCYPHLKLSATTLLPRSLTTLRCLEFSPDDLSKTDWPPTLTDLTVTGLCLAEELFLQCLPKTLKKLSIRSITNASHFTLLPPSLTFFSGKVHPDFLQYAMDRKIVWLTSANLVNPVQRKFYLPNDA